MEKGKLFLSERQHFFFWVLGRVRACARMGEWEELWDIVCTPTPPLFFFSDYDGLVSRSMDGMMDIPDTFFCCLRPMYVYTHSLPLRLERKGGWQNLGCLSEDLRVGWQAGRA